MVTIRDVADNAGVAISTASYALNGKGNLSEKTRRRVLAVAHQLGYVPNMNARGTKTGHGFLLGILLRETSHPLVLQLIEGIDQTAFEHGYTVAFYITGHQETRERRVLDQLRGRQVSGVIVADWRDKNPRELAYPVHLPVVYTNHRSYTGPASCVLVDNFQGGYLATRHLVALGHRNIAYIGGPHDRPSNRDRYAGYCRALEESNLALQKRLVKSNPKYQFQCGYTSMQHLLDNRGFTAAFAGNDELAMGAITACIERGVHVPRDVAVVGYDGTSIGNNFRPSLTSVQLPLRQVGRTAARLLIEAIQEKSQVGVHVQVPCRLLVRGSCGAMAPAVQI